MSLTKAYCLLTGATGFLGKSIHAELTKTFQVTTLGRSDRSDIQWDLGTSTLPELPEVFEWVVHNAGKAHMIPQTAVERNAFYQVNYQGTLHLLEALEKQSASLKTFIFISTVAVYGQETGQNIPETQPLEGKTPYAESKIQAEKAIQKWCQKKNINCVILRLPLVAGKKPPGNLGSIINAIKKGQYFSISNNQARKSIVLAKDIAQLIPNLTGKNGIYNLTDGKNPTFAEIETAVAEGLGKKIPLVLPKSLVSILAKFGDIFNAIGLPFPLTSGRLHKMTSLLTFSDEKARVELGWSPHPAVDYIKTMF